jgi:hypothetical protein
MIMRVLKVIFIAIIAIFITKSGNSQSINHIWVGHYSLTMYWESDNMKSDIPYLIDLRNSNVAKIKYFAGRQIETNWELADSVLTIDNVKYKLVALTEDSLVYSPNLTKKEKPVEEEIVSDDIAVAVPIKDELFVFKKIQNINIPYSASEVQKILENKVLLNANQPNDGNLDYGDWFEFLDNGVALQKMDIKEKKEKHLQSECWKIESYENYLFLVFNSKMIPMVGSQGFLTDGYQIAYLDTERIILNNFIFTNKAEYLLTSPSKNEKIQESLYGKWISINDTSKFYMRRYSKRAVADGRIKLFSDTLTYELKKDSLTITPNEFKPYSCNWRINSDGTVFIFEYKVENEYYNGYYVEYANFVRKSDDTFELELYNNSRLTGLEKPRSIFYNKFQTFKRIK